MIIKKTIYDTRRLRKLRTHKSIEAERIPTRKGSERQWRQAFVLRPPEGPSELERLRRLVQAYALPSAEVAGYATRNTCIGRVRTAIEVPLRHHVHRRALHHRAYGIPS